MEQAASQIAVGPSDQRQDVGHGGCLRTPAEHGRRHHDDVVRTPRSICSRKIAAEDDLTGGEAFAKTGIGGVLRAQGEWRGGETTVGAFRHPVRSARQSLIVGDEDLHLLIDTEAQCLCPQAGIVLVGGHHRGGAAQAFGHFDPGIVAIAVDPSAGLQPVARQTVRFPAGRLHLGQRHGIDARQRSTDAIGRVKHRTNAFATAEERGAHGGVARDGHRFGINRACGIGRNAAIVGVTDHGAGHAAGQAHAHGPTVLTGLGFDRQHWCGTSADLGDEGGGDASHAWIAVETQRHHLVTGQGASLQQRQQRAQAYAGLLMDEQAAQRAVVTQFSERPPGAVEHQAIRFASEHTVQAIHQRRLPRLRDGIDRGETHARLGIAQRRHHGRRYWPLTVIADALSQDAQCLHPRGGGRRLDDACSEDCIAITCTRRDAPERPGDPGLGPGGQIAGRQRLAQGRSHGRPTPHQFVLGIAAPHRQAVVAQVVDQLGNRPLRHRLGVFGRDRRCRC